MNLRNHPGVPIASALMVLGFLVGIEHGIYRAFGGAALMGLFWIPVLLTARERNDDNAA